MKFLRSLGLLAATVCLAVVLPAAASATELTNGSGMVTTESTVSAEAEGSITFTGPAGVECTGSSISAKTTNTGGASETAKASVSTLDFTGCSQTVTVLAKGTLELHTQGGSANGNGTLTSSGTEVTIKWTSLGIDCIYSTSSTHLGTLTGSTNTGGTATFDISATVPRTGGSIFCGSTGKWEGAYKVTTPDTLNVDTVTPPPAATTLTTSLSGEEKSGEEITVLEGAKVKDTATLSGENSSSATGTVKYKVYADKECKELVISAGEVTVTSGSVPASEEKTLEAGRVYYWQAEYSGDSKNAASKSTCGKEVLTIKAATTLTTSLSGEEKSGEEITVLEGAKVKDTATLSGTKSSTATGKAKYKVYSDSKCETQVAEAGEVTVAEGKVPASEEKTLEAGTIYYWQAEYAGDSLHQASKSTCGKEVLTIKAATTLTTSLSGEEKSGEEITVDEGAKVKDTATLSGTKSSTATGKAKYKVYSDNKCEKLVTEAGEVTVAEGKVPASEEKTLEAGTIYYWQVSYEGDSLHEKSTSPCSEKAIIKATTTIATSLLGEGQSGDDIEVEPETPVTDTATLEGTNSTSATGTIDYAVYEDDECEELVKGAGEGAVAGGEAAPSEEVELPAGIYYWQASYSGDVTHEKAVSLCNEREKVAPGTTLTTLLLGAVEVGEEEELTGEEIEVLEGIWVRDSAALGGENAETATGYVEYSIYSDEECEELVAIVGGGEFEEEEEGEGIPTSNYVNLPAGTYYWQATYSGDDSNKASASVCGDEVLVVEEASLTTVLSGGGQSGSELDVEEETPVTDLATLHLAKPTTATGTIKYDVYYDEECEELAEEGGEFSLEAEGKVPSSLEVSLPAGTYYWQATYSGDLTHPELTDECGEEVMVVAGDTSLETLLSGGGESGAEIEVREGEPVVDSAALSGPNTESATGTIEYAVYTDESCEEFFTHAGGGAVEGETIAGSEELELPEGTYYWQATYSGDLNNQEAESPCGSEIVTVGDAAVTTTLSGGGESGPEIEVGEEVPVKDTATLNIEKASTATGMIEYFVYKDKQCEEMAKEAGGGAVEGETIASSEEIELPEGVYYWRAHYLGDKSHPEAWSVCGAEIQRVAPAKPPWIISVGDSYISGEGGRWAGNIRWNNVPRVSRRIDALGSSAYKNPENDEAKDEEIPRCHRSKSAEIFIRYADKERVLSKNLACSGAQTVSEGFWGGKPLQPKLFTPGLDETDKAKNQPLPKGNIPCVLAVCKGQVLKLKEFAANVKNQGEVIKMVVLSIGGNDFGFAGFVAACAKHFIAHLATPLLYNKLCKDDKEWKDRFENAGELGKKEAMLQAAIERVGAAMAIHFPTATILVQDYPSPIPKAAGFRYPAGVRRVAVGRCPIRDADADWANDVALAKIDETVKKAALAARVKYPVIKFMELKEAFNGRRLCEAGVDLVGRFYPVKRWTQWNPNNPANAAFSLSEWINQVRLLTTGDDAFGNHFFLQEDLHPNYWGQLGLRSCVRKAYVKGALLPVETSCKVDTLAPNREPIPAGVPPKDVPTWMHEPKMILTP